MSMNYESCTLCPRMCGADRTKAPGFCGASHQIKAARAALHQWEEPCISGTAGSGTVFFSGCTLKCVFCQNYDISCKGFGKESSTALPVVAMAVRPVPEPAPEPTPPAPTFTGGGELGFAAASGNGHQLLNLSTEDVVYLEVGDRSAGDEVFYPDDDLQAILQDGRWQALERRCAAAGAQLATMRDSTEKAAPVWFCSSRMVNSV